MARERDRNDSRRYRDDRDDRDFMDRLGDGVNSWFGDDEAEHRRQRDQRNQRESGRGRDYDSQGYERGLGGRGYDRIHAHGEYGQDFYDPSDYGRGYAFAGEGNRAGDRHRQADSSSYGRGGYGRQRGDHQEGPHAGRGPKGYRRSDERIKEEVSERLERHGWIDASNLEVQVENGEVTLTGTVDSRRTKRLAEDVSEAVYGVRDVHNQLRVQEGSRVETPQQHGTT